MNSSNLLATGDHDLRNTLVEDLFIALIAIPSSERAAWLAEQSQAKPHERIAAQEMLKVFESSADRVTAAIGALRVELHAALSEGEANAGRYVLLQPIGSGSFGEVFLGRQEEPVRRLVAVKILRDALISPILQARFRIEQQAAASLNHPGIAGMLDSGKLADGRPWFAMPFVSGLAITDFARERSLTVRARVELLILICDAVEHAHRRGVIHRDLKPANILVETDGSTSRPRVIDFGVAKLADAAFAGTSANTVEGALVGTPEYMAPEQAEAATPDTRADCFSLGVVLYELLADRLPRDPKMLRANGRAGLAQSIRTASVALPSSLAPTSRAVNGDLDAIAMKSVAADASTRYQSVADFRTDLERWLQGEMPAAAQSDALRNTIRFVRRHRKGVAITAAVIIALGASSIYSFQQATEAQAARLRAEDARQQALRRADQNARVLEYVTGILAGADPTMQGGREDVTVREQLELATRNLDTSALKDAPLETAEIRFALGDAFSGIGRTDDATAQYKMALDLLASSGADAPALEAKISIQCASVLSNTNKGADALLFAEKATAAARRVPNDQQLLGRALTSLADAIRVDAKNLDRAKSTIDEAIVLLRTIPSAKADLAAALNNLGLVQFDYGKFDEGIAATEEAIAINKELGQAGSYKAMFDLHNLSNFERASKRYADAQRHAQEALVITDRLAGKKHPQRAAVLANLALIKRAQKEYAAGEAYQREGLEVLQGAGRGTSPDAGIALLNLASLLRDQEKFAEAVSVGREAVRVIDAQPGQDPWISAAARMALGRALTANKEYLQAELPLKEAWGLLEPLALDPKRRSSALLALCQLYKVWNKADPVALPDSKLNEWRDRVRAFEVEFPGSIPENSY